MKKLTTIEYLKSLGFSLEQVNNMFKVSGLDIENSFVVAHNPMSSMKEFDICHIDGVMYDIKGCQKMSDSTLWDVNSTNIAKIITNTKGKLKLIKGEDTTDIANYDNKPVLQGYFAYKTGEHMKFIIDGSMSLSVLIADKKHLPKLDFITKEYTPTQIHTVSNVFDWLKDFHGGEIDDLMLDLAGGLIFSGMFKPTVKTRRDSQK